MIHTSTSLNKRKKGLSVSLDKNKRPNDESFQTTSAFRTTTVKQSLESANSSARKNRIKFAQSYQKHETGSKFKRQNYLKITDQDIKLGGSKKIDRDQRKILPFSIVKPFSDECSSINMRIKPRTNVIMGERKVLRQSKVTNLTSNISYFQGMNLQKQIGFCVPNLAKLNVQPLSSVCYEPVRPVQKLQTLVETKLQESQLSRKETEGMSPSPFKKLSTEQQKLEIKQSMDRQTLQKLKKVQIDIDQLLAKASQTRAMLLR